MKTLLLFLFLSTNNQTIIYNSPYEEFYVIDVSTNPIQILVIEEDINLEISCIQNESYSLKDIEFTNNSACLMDTLNQNFNLNIQDYADLKNEFSKNDIKNIKQMNLSTIYNLITKTDTSYNLSDLYQIYSKTKKNEFQYEIHYLTYIKTNSGYIPIAYPL